MLIPTIITLIIFLSALTFIFFKVKKSQDQDVIENYSSTDAESCRSVHKKFWERSLSNFSTPLGKFVLNYCPICEIERSDEDGYSTNS
jgi:hypothetical protein